MYRDSNLVDKCNGEKRQKSNLDVSSQQGGLVREWKLPKRTNCLLKKYWHRKACQPGLMSLRSRNSLEKCHWPVGSASRIPTNRRPGKGHDKSQSVLLSVWCTYAPCMSRPLLVFGMDPASKIATAEILWGYSSITIPKYLWMSQLDLTFCFFFLLILLLFCHFNDIKSYQKVTLKDTCRKEWSKLLSCLSHLCQPLIQLLQCAVWFCHRSFICASGTQYLQAMTQACDI